MIKKDTKSKPKIKPVSFVLTNETDLNILEFISDNNLAFSSYVKDLIIKDMRKSQENNEIAEAINNLANTITKAISNNSLDISYSNIENNNTVDKEKKNIIGNILNMPK